MKKQNTHFSVVQKTNKSGEILYKNEYKFTFDAEDKFMDLVREYYVRGNDFKSDIFSTPLERSVVFEDGTIITIYHLTR